MKNKKTQKWYKNILFNKNLIDLKKAYPNTLNTSAAP